MKLQIDLPEELHKQLKIIKDVKGFQNLQEALMWCLSEFIKTKKIEKIGGVWGLK